MLVQEIKDQFKEYGVGIASASDVELALLGVGHDIRPTLEAISPNSISRPMFVASMYRILLTDRGFTPADVARMIPPEVSGPITMSDLQLSLIKLGTDYIGPDGATIVPGIAII